MPRPPRRRCRSERHHVRPPAEQRVDRRVVRRMPVDREEVGAYAGGDREAIGDLPPVACVRIPLPAAERRLGRAEVDGHVVPVGDAERQRVEAREAPCAVRAGDALADDVKALHARAERDQVARAERQRQVVAERERRRADAGLRVLRRAAVQRDAPARRRWHRHADDRLIRLADRLEAIGAPRQQQLVVPTTGTAKRGVHVQCAHARRRGARHECAGE
jgi:hypothetical protein